MGSNDLTYSQEIFESILQIVADVTGFGFKDEPLDIEINPHELFEKSEIVPKCVLIRGFYAGMKGDVKNMWKFAYTWNQRLANNNWKIWFSTALLLAEPLNQTELSGEYNLYDVTIEGIDAGCSGMVTHLIKYYQIKKYLENIEDPEGFLRSKLWDDRSGLNSRMILSETQIDKLEYVLHTNPVKSYDEDFNKIVLPLADAYSRKHLFGKFNK